MRDYEPVQKIIQKDGLPLVIGGGSVLGFSLADVATVAQQLGVIGGAILVFITIAHRLFIFWKDMHK